jgi:hypothetical protein
LPSFPIVDRETKGSLTARSAGRRPSLLESLDSPFDGVNELRVVLSGMLSHELDRPAIPVRDLPAIATSLEDLLSQPGVPVVDLRIRFQQCTGGSLGLIQLAGLDEVQHRIGISRKRIILFVIQQVRARRVMEIRELL